MSLLPEDSLDPFDEELELPGVDLTRDTGLWDPEDDHLLLPEEEQAMHLEVEPED